MRNSRLTYAAFVKSITAARIRDALDSSAKARDGL